MSSRPTKPLKVGVAGIGAVGMPVARWLDGGVDGLVLAAVSAADKERAKSRIADFKTPPPVLDLGGLVDSADVLLEGLPP